MRVDDMAGNIYRALPPGSSSVGTLKMTTSASNTQSRATPPAPGDSCGAGAVASITSATTLHRSMIISRTLLLSGSWPSATQGGHWEPALERYQSMT
jgi:hypothetical protein